ncbi:metalloregulator ArsR/SmtB family transcription factor [soil metagenome]
MHVFTLLGDPVRLRIVELLAAGERPVWRLAEQLEKEFGIGRNAVSMQLRTLRDHDFVTSRAEGSVRRYRLVWNALDRLDEAVEALFAAWERRDGWPYADRLDMEIKLMAKGRSLEPPRMHRAGRASLRGTSVDEVEPRAGGDDEDYFAGMGL